MHPIWSVEYYDWYKREILVVYYQHNGNIILVYVCVLGCDQLCDLMDCNLLASSVHGILPAWILEWVAISFTNAWKWKVKNEVAQLCLTLSDPIDCQPTRLFRPCDFPGKSTGVECHCLLHYDPMGVSNLISGSSAFSKSSLYTWKLSVHILLKPCLKDFKHYHASVWNEHNCVVVRTFFGIALLWDWNENWPFPVQQTTSHFFITLFLNNNKTKNTTSKPISQKALSKKGRVGCPKFLSSIKQGHWQKEKKMYVLDILSSVISIRGSGSPRQRWGICESLWMIISPSVFGRH